MDRAAHHDEPVDVLIVAALKMEYDAVLDAGRRALAGHPGVGAWDERDADHNSCSFGTFRLAGGGGFSVAVARPTRMGGITTATIAASLIPQLKPQCLAMAGVCAGNPGDVALGDVVIAELAYQYDEGKRTLGGFEPDHRQVPMPETWTRAAQELSQDDLPSYGRPTDEEARAWMLDLLASGIAPRTHPSRPAYFTTNDAWTDALAALEADGLVTRPEASPEITDAGRALAERRRHDDITGPERLPFRVVVGPIASGNVVVKDAVTWDALAQMGVRTVKALEMEAAAVARVAADLDVPTWAVAKGVMDYADPRKDDRYKPFAARASAEVLFKLLADRVGTPAARAPGGARSPSARFRFGYVIGGVTEETEFADYELAAITDVCRQLGERLALSGAELIVCSVFEDSADLYTIMGYLDSSAGRTVHLHAPKHESVDERKRAMLKMLGDDGRRLRSWDYPGPESEESWGQAWLLCQLRALETADVVFAVGGRVSKTANTLLHLADARRIPIVPLTFLGGAARRAYDRVDWSGRYPEVDTSGLHDRRAVRHAVDVANQLVTARAPRRRSETRTVFISRASADAPFADALRAFIERTGRTALLGDEQVRSDRIVHRAIDDALVKCDVVVVLWSRAYALSPFCSDELEDALDHEREVWLFNLDDSEVVPRRARRLPPYRTHTPQALIDTVDELLDRRG